MMGQEVKARVIAFPSRLVNKTMPNKEITTNKTISTAAITGKGPTITKGTKIKISMKETKKRRR